MRVRFDDQGSWKAFFDHWHQVMYAVIETEYEIAWKVLQDHCEEDHWNTNHQDENDGVDERRSEMNKTKGRLSTP